MSLKGRPSGVTGMSREGGRTRICVSSTSRETGPHASQVSGWVQHWEQAMVWGPAAPFGGGFQASFHSAEAKQLQELCLAERRLLDPTASTASSLHRRPRPLSAVRRKG